MRYIRRIGKVPTSRGRELIREPSAAELAKFQGTLSLDLALLDIMEDPRHLTCRS
jgi:hypothetical protein